MMWSWNKAVQAFDRPSMLLHQAICKLVSGSTFDQIVKVLLKHDQLFGQQEGE